VGRRQLRCKQEQAGDNVNTFIPSFDPALHWWRSTFVVPSPPTCPFVPTMGRRGRGTGGGLVCRVGVRYLGAEASASQFVCCFGGAVMSSCHFHFGLAVVGVVVRLGIARSLFVFYWFVWRRWAGIRGSAPVASHAALPPGARATGHFSFVSSVLKLIGTRLPHWLVVWGWLCRLCSCVSRDGRLAPPRHCGTAAPQSSFSHPTWKVCIAHGPAAPQSGRPAAFLVAAERAFMEASHVEREVGGRGRFRAR